MVRLRHALPCVPFLLAPSGCEMLEAKAPPPQVIDVRISSDPGVPLAGAALTFDGKEVARTDAAGLGQVKLEGVEGETFDISVVCPEGHRSPAKPLQITLRRLAGDKRPEYQASCPPTLRSVVVAVRAENGLGVPVVYLGREVARTDASGAAHVHLRLRPDEPFELTLRTDDASGGDRLRPQNPTASFVVKDQDEVFTFDQRFDQLARPRTYAPAKPKGPVRIP